MENIMKKIISLILCLCIIFMFNACGNMVKDNDTPHMKQTAKQIIRVINNKDKETLKQMFSENAISESGDIDSQITKLFDYVGGILNCDYDDYSASIDGSYNQADNQTKTVFKGTYSSDNGRQYYICFIEYSHSPDAKDDGIYMIKAVDMAYRTELNVSIYSNIYAGIYVPTQEELSKINSKLSE